MDSRAKFSLGHRGSFSYGEHWETLAAMLRTLAVLNDTLM